MMNEQDVVEILEQTHLERAIVQERDTKWERRLGFAGAKNFRDLGGYPTLDGRSVRWRVLFRSDGLHRLTKTDRKTLSALDLCHIIDFRAQHEKQREPDRIPRDMASCLVEIPILDNSARPELVKNLRSLDPVRYMIETNIELATRFTPEMRQFIHVLLSSNGRPILFHCAAGKDRTGFAAAITLRILGVPHQVLMDDYLLTNQYFFPAYRWHLVLARFLRGKQFVETVKKLMIADHSYLSAGFEAIDRRHGSFQNYVQNGLGLSAKDVYQLQSMYLE